MSDTWVKLAFYVSPGLPGLAVSVVWGIRSLRSWIREMKEAVGYEIDRLGRMHRE